MKSNLNILVGMPEKERVFRRVLIIAGAAGEELEARLGVQTDGGLVGGADLEENAFGMPGSGFGQQCGEKSRAHAAAAEGRQDGDVLQFPLGAAALGDEEANGGRRGVL